MFKVTLYYGNKQAYLGENTQSNCLLGGYITWPTCSFWPCGQPRLQLESWVRLQKHTKKGEVYIRGRWHPGAPFMSSIWRIPLGSCSRPGAIEIKCQKSPVPWVPFPGHLDSILMKAPETTTILIPRPHLEHSEDLCSSLVVPPVVLKAPEAGEGQETSICYYHRTDPLAMNATP